MKQIPTGLRLSKDRVRQLLTSIALFPVLLVVDLASFWVWLVRVLKRRHTVRKVFLLLASVGGIASFIWGGAKALAAFLIVLQFGLQVGMMIGQFALLMLFLGSSKTIDVIPGDKKTITFDRDYFGNKAEVNMVRTWTKLLTADRARLEALGGQPVRGFLLTGPPGVGKTHMARCLAADCNAGFLGMTGSDFMSLWMGMGAFKVMTTAAKAVDYAKRYGACVTPDTLILTNDLRWVRADSLREGDRLVGIEETAQGRHKRRLRPSIVEAAKPDRAELVRVVTDRGEIVVTTDHPFLAHDASGMNGQVRGVRGTLSWTEASHLSIGQGVKFLGKPWNAGDGDSWLAGMLDGEGHLGLRRGQPTSVCVTQKYGPVFDRLGQELKRRGFDAVIAPGSTNAPQWYIRGGIAETLRLLGTVRPMRLLERWTSSDYRPALPQGTWARVVSIESIGEGPIIRLQTSSRTYFANGFASHNCILFIDEIDAIASARGGVQGGGAMNPMVGMMGGGGLGVLQRLLSVMDGLEDVDAKTEAKNLFRGWFGLPLLPIPRVLFIGATNRPDVLDPAIKRPGRFDQTISIGMPDATTRAELFRGYLAKIANGVSEQEIRWLVSDTQGVSHSHIASAVRKGAARLALFDDRTAITYLDIVHAVEENLFGLPNPIENWDPDQRAQVAYHEAGHAVMTSIVSPEKRIARVSIIRRTAGTLGYMVDLDQVEIFARPLEDFAARIMTAMSGHIATMIWDDGRPWTGASADFQHVRQLLGTLASLAAFDDRIPSNPADPLSDEPIKVSADRYLKTLWEQTDRLLRQNWEKVRSVAGALLEKSELTSPQIAAILGIEIPEEDQRAV